MLSQWNIYLADILMACLNTPSILYEVDRMPATPIIFHDIEQFIQNYWIPYEIISAEPYSKFEPQSK